MLHYLRDSLKFAFMSSLVLTTTLFNAHVRVLDGRALAVLNGVYMRVLRRIVSQVRFDSSVVSDLEVRRLAGWPSLDCLIQRTRLRYLARLTRGGHRPLLALLGACDKQGRLLLPWARLLRDDLQSLHANVTEPSRSMPDPVSCPDAWQDLMVDKPAVFHRYVEGLFYVASVCDTCSSVGSSVAKTFVCDLCPAPLPAFKSSKALESHKRVKHGCRTEMRYYADAGGVCPTCAVNFRSRLRLLAHLVRRDRPRCRQHILATGVPKLSEEAVAALDLEDRLSRRAALKAGHTHVIAVGSAVRPDGRITGKVSA